MPHGSALRPAAGGNVLSPVSVRWQRPQRFQDSQVFGVCTEGGIGMTDRSELNSFVIFSSSFLSPSCGCCFISLFRRRRPECPSKYARLAVSQSAFATESRPGQHGERYQLSLWHSLLICLPTMGADAKSIWSSLNLLLLSPTAPSTCSVVRQTTKKLACRCLFECPML